MWGTTNNEPSFEPIMIITINEPVNDYLKPIGSLGFTCGGVHSLGFDGGLMTCIHYIGNVFNKF